MARCISVIGHDLGRKKGREICQCVLTDTHGTEFDHLAYPSDGNTISWPRTELSFPRVPSMISPQEVLEWLDVPE